MLSATDFFELQCLMWPDVAKNHQALEDCCTRNVKLSGDAYVVLLYNPARARSTAAKIDAQSIMERPCFLCADNRPAQQIIHKGLDDIGYDMLVNPYPILNPHFTIVCKKHIPQQLPLDAMTTAASRFPGLLFFFNGAKAGASAPDHLHFQAVAKKCVPLVGMTERAHDGLRCSICRSNELGIKHPALFFSSIGDKPHFDIEDGELMNFFVWQREDGRIQSLYFPRKRHRPLSYPEPTVSPGALDVAGIMVTVRRHDFDSLSDNEIETIYSETCFTSL